MSLTKEDLQAISDLMDLKFDEQDKKFDKKLDVLKEELKEEFKEMLVDNNLLIAEHVQRVIQESQEGLTKEIK